MNSEGLVPQLVLAQAIILARNGNYQAAESLLAAGDRVPEDSATLDILARIRAQRGDLLTAAKLWQSILKRDPQNPGALAGLRRVQSERHPQRALQIVLGSAAALVCVMLAGSYVSTARHEIAAGQEQAKQTVLDGISAVQAATQAQLASDESAHAAAAQQMTAKLAVLDHVAGVEDETQAVLKKQLEQANTQLRELVASQHLQLETQKNVTGTVEEGHSAVLKRIEAVAVAQKQQDGRMDALAARQQEGLDSLKGEFTRLGASLSTLEQEVAKLTSPAKAESLPTPSPPEAKPSPEVVRKPGTQTIGGASK